MIYFGSNKLSSLECETTSGNAVLHHSFDRDGLCQWTLWIISVHKAVSWPY
jgi:hypothetical protein